jgi:hypothetical protein
MNELPVITQKQNPRRAHCEFCGGVGQDLKVDLVESAIGTRYRIPKNHISCRESVLSLSLDFKPARKKRRKER